MRAFWMRLFSGWGKERLDVFARSRSARWCEHRSLPAVCWSKRQLRQWERFSDCIGWLRLEDGRTIRSGLKWCIKILIENPGYRSDVWKAPYTFKVVYISEDDSRDHPYFPLCIIPLAEVGCPCTSPLYMAISRWGDRSRCINVNLSRFKMKIEVRIARKVGTVKKWNYWNIVRTPELSLSTLRFRRMPRGCRVAPGAASGSGPRPRRPWGPQGSRDHMMGSCKGLVLGHS